jgi:hypothetical protein
VLQAGHRGSLLLPRFVIWSGCSRVLRTAARSMTRPRFSTPHPEWSTTPTRTASSPAANRAQSSGRPSQYCSAWRASLRTRSHSTRFHTERKVPRRAGGPNRGGGVSRQRRRPQVRRRRNPGSRAGSKTWWTRGSARRPQTARRRRVQGQVALWSDLGRLCSVSARVID